MIFTEQNVHRTEISPALILSPQQTVEPAWVPNCDPGCNCRRCQEGIRRRAEAKRLGLAEFLAEEDRRRRAFVRRFRR